MVQPTTPANLRDHLGTRDPAVLWISGDSDVLGLTEFLGNPGRFKSLTLSARPDKISFCWCGENGSRLENYSKLVELVRVVNRYAKWCKPSLLTFSLPFQAGDMGVLFKELKKQSVLVGRLCLEQVHDDSVNDLLDGLEYVTAVTFLGQPWFKSLILKPKLYPDPAFIQKLSPILPKLNLEELQIDFKVEKKANDIPIEDFAQQLKNSFYKLLQDGLEHNFFLRKLTFSTMDESLWKAVGGYPGRLMEGLNLTPKIFRNVLTLNKPSLGRQQVLSMPKHLDTWLEVISQQNNDLDCGPFAYYSGDLEAIFYYLRRNTWMFLPNRESVEMAESSEKRHSEEMEKKNKFHLEEMKTQNKRHLEEMEKRDLEIQSLREQLKRHKVELDEFKRQNSGEA